MKTITNFVGAVVFAVGLVVGLVIVGNGTKKPVAPLPVTYAAYDSHALDESDERRGDQESDTEFHQETDTGLPQEREWESRGVRARPPERAATASPRCEKPKRSSEQQPSPEPERPARRVHPERPKRTSACEAVLPPAPQSAPEIAVQPAAPVEKEAASRPATDMSPPAQYYYVEPVYYGPQYVYVPYSRPRGLRGLFWRLRWRRACW